MTETTLYPLMIDGANQEGWALYRIADGSAGKKPFDIAGCDSQGRAVGLEVKIVRRRAAPDDPFPWELFRPHQIAWLRQFAGAGALALAALYHAPEERLAIYQLTIPAALDSCLAELWVGDLRIARPITGFCGLLLISAKSREF